MIITPDSIQAHARLMIARRLHPAALLVLVLCRGGKEMGMSELAADVFGGSGRGAMTARAAMTGHVDRLERDGLVERRGNDADRRQVWVGLTGKGQELIEAMISSPEMATS